MVEGMPPSALDDGERRNFWLSIVVDIVRRCYEIMARERMGRSVQGDITCR